MWIGFAALLQGRYALFSLFVILVAQFKLTSIFFAVLPRPDGAAAAIAVPTSVMWRSAQMCLRNFKVTFRKASPG